MASLKVNASLSALDVETSTEAYRFALSKNKVITFPNPVDMPWDEAEKFAALWEDPSTTLSDRFSTWLSEEDYQKLVDEKLNMLQLGKLAELVGKYYEEALGDLPKE